MVDDIQDKKIVYLAHPINGDIEGNSQKILDIMREIHTKEPHIVPMAPYITTLRYLDDNLPEERRLGMDANMYFFYKGFIDELWLCGPKISTGMKEEIKHAVINNILIVCFNKELEPLLKEQLEFDKTALKTTKIV